MSNEPTYYLHVLLNCPIRPWLVIYWFPVPWFIITPCGQVVIFYYCISNIITLLLLADIQFSRFYNWTIILLQHFSMQAIYHHTPKFSLNKRAWPTKLLIISVDAGAKIACGWGTGNYYITSDGLSNSTWARLKSMVASHCYSYYSDLLRITLPKRSFAFNHDSTYISKLINISLSPSPGPIFMISCTAHGPFSSQSSHECVFPPETVITEHYSYYTIATARVHVFSIRAFKCRKHLRT